MADDTRKRDVIPFPAELRNIIYPYLVRKTYLVCWPLWKENNLSGFDIASTLPQALAESPILQVSKVTRKEALALLYSESTFRYWVDRTQRSHHYRRAMLRKEALDLIQNVEIYISVPNVLSDLPGEITLQTCLDIVEKLNDAKIIRNSLWIRFDNSDVPTNGQTIWEIYQTLANLRRFRTITIEVRGGQYQPNPAENIPIARVRTLIQPAIASRLISECDFAYGNVLCAMEPILGPIVEEGEVEDAKNVCCARYFKFDPQNVATTLL